MSRAREKRTCAKKVKYPTRAIACAAAASHKAGLNGLRTYSCDVCGGWHLTTRGGGKAKARRIYERLGLRT